MQTLFLDPSNSGISGDMLVGALCDLGVSPSVLEWELSKLGAAAGDFHLHFERGRHGEVEGVKFTVHTGAVHTHDQDEAHEERGQIHAQDDDGCGCGHDHGDDHDHGHDHAEEHDHDHTLADTRSYADLRAAIEGADLSAFVQRHALGALGRIVTAEAALRNVAPEQIAFSVEGALDTLTDLVCVCAGVEALGVGRVLVGRLVDGQTPSPTTLGILRAAGAPPPAEINEPHELVTPTGAALAAELAWGTGGGFVSAEPAGLRAEKTGHGFGTHKLSDRANALRASLHADDQPGVVR